MILNNVSSPPPQGGRFPIEKAVSGEKQSSTDVVQTPRESGARRYSLRELISDSFRISAKLNLKAGAANEGNEL